MTDIPAVRLVPSPKRVRVKFAGETIADTLAASLVYVPGRTPVYFFPVGDVRTGWLTRAATGEPCPHRGPSVLWNASVNSHTASNAATSYPEPTSAAAAIADMITFRWHAMDSWWEEDEEIFVHPRDPFVRLDILPSHRSVEVVLDGTTIASSRHALFVFETGQPTRYYLPRADLRMDLLHPADTRTSCPYKGDAEYWSASINGAIRTGVAWSYPDPAREAGPLRGYICFFNEHADAILVDGVPQPRPTTKWS